MRRLTTRGKAKFLQEIAAADNEPLTFASLTALTPHLSGSCRRALFERLDDHVQEACWAEVASDARLRRIGGGHS